MRSPARALSSKRVAGRRFANHIAFDFFRWLCQMAAVVLLVSLGSAFSKGYHSFTATYSRPFHIKLSKNILVFALDEAPPAGANFSVIDRKNHSIPVPLDAFTHMQFFETTLFISVARGSEFTLHFWLVPPSLCNGISYSSVADHTLAFDLASRSLKSDFCVFSQSGASSYSALVSFQSGNPGGAIEFYKHPRRPAERCRHNRMCSFSSSHPFFMRATGVAKASFSASVAYSVGRRSIRSAECGIAVMPFVIEPPMQVPMGVLVVSNIRCVAAADVVLKYIVFMTAGAVVALLALLGLHWSGFINVRAVLGCRGESAHFNALRENPLARELEDNEVPEGDA